MISFKSQLKKFGNKAEKSGWTYIEVSAEIANQLKPCHKRSFRVKGKIDELHIAAIALIPMGEGDFILPVNASMRKTIKKIEGSHVNILLELDDEQLAHDVELIACLSDANEAISYFKSLPLSHQNWFSNWIKGAKTESTKTKRIATVVTACFQRLTFAEMMKMYRTEKKLIQ